MKRRRKDRGMNAGQSYSTKSKKTGLTLNKKTGADFGKFSRPYKKHKTLIKTKQVHILESRRAEGAAGKKMVSGTPKKTE